MRNAGQDEAENGIKIAGRNVNNLRYADDNADDTTFMEESEEELKSLLMKVKVEGEEPRWRRSRTGRTLSPPQIHQKSI